MYHFNEDNGVFYFNEQLNTFWIRSQYIVYRKVYYSYKFDACNHTAGTMILVSSIDDNIIISNLCEEHSNNALTTYNKSMQIMINKRMLRRSCLSDLFQVVTETEAVCLGPMTS